jgi:hypothetical protein
MQDELERLKGKKADKEQRLENLRTKASSHLVQIRRALGGQYVEDVLEIDVEEARLAINDLEEVVREARQLDDQIDEIEDILDT